MDISKAFDTVDHSLLLHKLNQYGVRGITLELIKNYLSDRKQRVKVGGITSEWVTTLAGVPQGTILGPLLFIVYMDDLLNDLEDIISNADDTAVLCGGSTWDEVVNMTNNNLKVVYQWMYDNKLAINISKTKFNAFANQTGRLPYNIQIGLNNTLIERVENIKYLGIYKDSALNWESHIKYLVSRLSYLLYVCARLKRVLNKPQLISVYYALFHSVATYGIIAWGGSI